jgi:hypothetical protein
MSYGFIAQAQTPRLDLPTAPRSPREAREAKRPH